MIQLLKFELLKIYNRKSIYIVLLGLLAIISLPIFSNTGSGKQAISYYSKWEGPITDEKMGKAKEESDQYFVETIVPGEKGTIVDLRKGVNSDEAYIKSGIVETMAYGKSRDEQKNDRLNAINAKIAKLAADDNFGYTYRKLILEKKMLTKVETLVLYYQKAAGEMIDFVNTFGIVISAVLIVLGISPIYTSEYASGVDQFILSSKNGRKKLTTAKLYASIIYVLSIIGVWTVFNAVVRIWIYGNNGWNTPIQFLYKYTNSPYNYTAKEYFIREMGMHTLAALGFAMFVIVVSSLCKNGIISFFISGSGVGVAFFLDAILDADMYWLRNINQFAYYGLMKVEGLFMEFKTVNVLGFPILYSVFAVILLIISSVILIKLLYMIMRRKQII